jgi:hypothetical protein
MNLIPLGLRFFWDDWRQVRVTRKDLIPQWKLSFHFGIKCMCFGLQPAFLMDFASPLGTGTFLPSRRARICLRV